MKFKCVLALVLLCLSSVVHAALTVNVFDWEAGTHTSFYECEIDFWHAEAYVDRDQNDGNYLYVACADWDEASPAPSESLRYETRGISHDEIYVTSGAKEFEGLGCYVTEHSLGTSNDAIRVECPVDEELRAGQGFESKKS